MNDPADSAFERARREDFSDAVGPLDGVLSRVARRRRNARVRAGAGAIAAAMVVAVGVNAFLGSDTVTLTPAPPALNAESSAPSPDGAAPLVPRPSVSSPSVSSPAATSPLLPPGALPGGAAAQWSATTKDTEIRCLSLLGPRGQFRRNLESSRGGSFHQSVWTVGSLQEAEQESVGVGGLVECSFTSANSTLAGTSSPPGSVTISGADLAIVQAYRYDCTTGRLCTKGQVLGFAQVGRTLVYLELRGRDTYTWQDGQKLLAKAVQRVLAVQGDVPPS